MNFDPISAAASLDEAYRTYLASTLRFGNPDLQRQFEEQMLEKGALSKGPILEATPPYKTGSTIRQLVDEGVLCQGMLRLDAELPSDRPLYTHQEEAIRNAAAGRNQAIVTGTGSGKTECFLIPIFDQLLRQHAEGDLKPGVRALVLYPMNALANDQLKRLRALLADVPEITFGRYTGETQNSAADARKQWRRQHPGVQPPVNELLSREAIRERPPHILLTNYAMLEYLLLRPADAPLFAGLFASTWSHIVVDEAHVYSGTLGTEIAYLIRRLKARLDVPQGHLRCFATSATIGSTREDHQQVARFATDLFGEPFGDALQGDTLDVVTSIQDAPQNEFAPQWGRLPADVWTDLSSLVAHDHAVDPAELARVLGGRAPDAQLGVLAAAASEWPAALGAILLGEATAQELIERLSIEPVDVGDAAGMEWCSVPLDRGVLSAVVQVLSRCSRAEGAQLLSARYHSFFRAPEGAFLALLDPPQLSLRRQTVRETEHGAVPVYEVATCRHCGQEYLLGHAERPRTMDNGQVVEVLAAEAPRESEEEEVPETYYMLEFDVEADEPGIDEDQATIPTNVQLALPQWLCPVCGTTHETPNSITGHLFDHERVRMVAIRETKARGDRKPCPRCGYQSPNALQRVRVSPESAGSIMVYDLVRSVPPMERALLSAEQDDEWLTTSTPAPDDRRAGSLICFSDRRQDAAFFAPALERTYGAVTKRQVLYEAARQLGENVFSPSDWAKQVSRLLARGKYLPTPPTAIEAKKIGWAWILGEMMSEDGRASLEGLGLVTFRPRGLDLLPVPGPLLHDPWSLTEEAARSLVAHVLDTMRSGHAIQWQEGILRADELMPAHLWPTRFVKLKTGDSGRDEKSWLPSKPGANNARLDYAVRTVHGKEPDPTAARTAALELMQGVWRAFIWNPSGPFREWLINEGDEMTGWVQAHPDLWDVCIDPEAGLARCETCGVLVAGSALDTCPTFRCKGHLVAVDPDGDAVDAYYRGLYRNDAAMPIAVEEHTAQLQTQHAAEIQEKFLRGAVNVLSCTTTFELGVDVGDLHSVFMRNVPPSPANYVQRAGRTGRRTGAPGYALTFARLRSHDLTYFNSPLTMISGRIPAPACYLDNEKIAERHVFAVALSSLFRSNPVRAALCRRVSDFFDPGSDLGPGQAELRAYLSERPDEVLRALRAVLPIAVAEALGLEEWRWVDALVGEDGRITAAQQALEQDWYDLEAEREQRLRTGSYVDWIARAQKRIREEQVIARLAAYGALPKYGFPTDLVELALPREVPESRFLEMQRGLRTAIQEYAPGSEVVAAKKTWKSSGLKRMPGKDWETCSYWVCKECGHFERTISAGDSSLSADCPVCHLPLGTSDTFVVPNFGFVARLVQNGVGERRPRSNGGVRTYFARDAISSSVEPAAITFPGGQAEVLYARNGTLYALNTGPLGTGFKICPSCGGAGPTTGSSVHLRRDCTGTIRGRQFLGTSFQTDVLEISLKPRDASLFAQLDPDASTSALWAVALSAAEMLMVPEMELGGTGYRLPGDRIALLLYDDVPGGAGRVQMLASRIPELLEAARERVSGACGCGAETSCYTCLRSYRNQFVHDRLSRAGALAVLDAVMLT